MELYETRAQRTPSPTTTPPAAFQVFTAGAVYEVDATMRCVSVRRLHGEGLPVEVLGALLVGGVRDGEGGFRFRAGIPRDGERAIFELSSREGMYRTSAVLHVARAARPRSA